MRIAAVTTEFPAHYYTQGELLLALKRHWGDRLSNPDVLERLHRRLRVDGRHLALPIEAYDELRTWGQANDAWIRVATELGACAVRTALERAGVPPAEVGTLIFTSVTGVASPSIDARIVNRLGLPASVRRLPLFGLGCVGGAAAIARASDIVRAYPDEVAIPGRAVPFRVVRRRLPRRVRGPRATPDRHVAGPAGADLAGRGECRVAHRLRERAPHAGARGIHHPGGGAHPQ
jgi:hypothetical protein